MIFYSDSVRVHNAVRGCVPARAALRPLQQHHRDPAGRLQDGDDEAEAAGAQGAGHRALAGHTQVHHVPLLRHQCE